MLGFELTATFGRILKVGASYYYVVSNDHLFRDSFMRNSLILVVLCGMLFVSNLQAAQTYWLSDIAPTKELAKKMRPSMGSGLVIRDNRGVTKKLWLRKGDDIANSAYVDKSNHPLILITPEAPPTELAFGNIDYADVTFKMPDEGFYNLFMTVKQIDNGVLLESVIKSEAMNHSCRSGHDHTQDMMPPLYFEGTSFDIIRKRFPRETFHTRITSGDIVSYEVLLHGKAVVGANVTMITQKGWSKTIKTNQVGMAHFEMIRDYYPPWHEFKKRNMETFLISAEYDHAESGVYQGSPYDSIHYKGTVSGNYYPSTRDYQSNLYGLLIGLFGLTVSVLLIYFYRRRRANRYGKNNLG
ncbi:MAG: hypothetical protein GY781_11395 [Gammaproteobacteria bacterium]|nr:hypothetical protein [Gammaproteobacteria bacterium]